MEIFQNHVSKLYLSGILFCSYDCGLMVLWEILGLYLPNTNKSFSHEQQNITYTYTSNKK